MTLDHPAKDVNERSHGRDAQKLKQAGPALGHQAWKSDLTGFWLANAQLNESKWSLCFREGHRCPTTAPKACATAMLNERIDRALLYLLSSGPSGALLSFAGQGRPARSSSQFRLSPHLFGSNSMDFYIA